MNKIIEKIIKFFKYKYKYYFLNKIKQNSEVIVENGIKKRVYLGGFENYLTHQKKKFDLYKNTLNRDFENQVNYFYLLFKNIKLTNSNRIYSLCLGARTGAEVKAFRKLNFFSIGVDINYPKNSPYVVYGDFHKLDFPDNSFDIIYSNCIDHCFDLKVFLSESKRLCNEDGIILFHIQKGSEDGSRDNFGDFEALGWKDANLIIKQIENEGLKKLSQKSINKSYIEVIFKK